MYLSLFAVLRFVMLRQSSTIGIADILVIVVLADAAQNGFSKEYKSITEGVLLVLTIVFWDIFLNWLSYRFKMFERLLSPAPLQLVKNGRMNRRNMRRGIHHRGGANGPVAAARSCATRRGERGVSRSERRDQRGESRILATAPKARRKKASERLIAILAGWRSTVLTAQGTNVTRPGFESNWPERTMNYPKPPFPDQQQPMPGRPRP